MPTINEQGISLSEPFLWMEEIVANYYKNQGEYSPISTPPVGVDEYPFLEIVRVNALCEEEVQLLLFGLAWEHRPEIFKDFIDAFTETDFRVIVGGYLNSNTQLYITNSKNFSLCFFK
ncbi:hypothetical protein [Flammeovirga kamogawensis]|uniref:Uncharacterized protein n=1 Tax=Flammeovirga kamogawensis TaxID=373891 RepID=A0ABX8GPV6_9BACT|nr:hypothetical protein [Flammeovirga kamogawensis]MBB6463449.1 hypothetical protein [Flammeovirga kamogawensis]QWG05625.1 hypothetical protein KM029_09535 [Flammeovirga kamogawensis]TRX67456.1 hypothetical protein EO216_04570 [Flammeovirga kamogawensis]